MAVRVHKALIHLFQFWYGGRILFHLLLVLPPNLLSGWSVCVNTSLLRDDDEAIEASKVGELLKNKAEEGLSVSFHF